MNCAQLLSCIPLFATPWTTAHQALCPWDYSGKNTGTGCHTLLQGSFPTQGSNLGLPHCKWILYHLNHCICLRLSRECSSEEVFVRGFQVGKIPQRRAEQPTPVFLPAKSRGQRSLAGYSPQGLKESDMTEATQHACTFCR